MNAALQRVIAVTTAGLAIFASLGAAPAVAHHGGGAEWQMGRPSGPITGVVTEFAFTFPHVQIYMDVTDDQGKTANWSLVMRWTPTILRKQGWTRETIKPGDKVTATYIPHKVSPSVGALATLELNGKPLDINFAAPTVGQP